jgi:hypothetical protein
LASVPTMNIFSGASRRDVVKLIPAGPPAPVHRIRFMFSTDVSPVEFGFLRFRFALWRATDLYVFSTG